MRLRARKDVSARQKFSAHQVGLMRRGKTDAKQGARCRDARLHLKTAVRGSAQRLQRSAKRRGCLLSYSHAEPGRELTQPGKHLLAEPCILLSNDTPQFRCRLPDKIVK